MLLRPSVLKMLAILIKLASGDQTATLVAAGTTDDIAFWLHCPFDAGGAMQPDFAT